MERNFLIKLAYDGAAYHGWQIQENALTVQQVFQEALGKITGLSEDIKACSRTDTGVHARQFCVSLKTESPIAPERLLAALNHYLPQDVAVRSVEQVPLDFHARYSCKGKEYVYQIWKRERGDLTRTVTKAQVRRQGDLVTFTVAADGFLYNMVRIMVGTLLRVQQGKFSPEDIPAILEARDRKAAGPTAPACGLYLNQVFY